jgi:hypothetical protein
VEQLLRRGLSGPGGVGCARLRFALWP